VLARRLDKARTALAQDQRRKIIEVAYSCGIESLSVFYRGFRDAYGMTPTEFRNSLLNPPPGGHAPQAVGAEA
jgi:AraC-like DNA-binding protein